MTDDLSSIKAELNALKRECLELRALVQQQSTGGDADQFISESPQPDEAPHAPEFPPRRPFEAWYDFVTREWKMYIPPRSVVVGDTEAEYNGNASNDIATISPYPTVYCHVTAKSGGDGYEFGFSASSENEDAAYIFPVVSFSQDMSEVAAQHVVGCVFIESVNKKRYASDKDDDTPFIMIDTSAEDKAQMSIVANNGSSSLSVNASGGSVDVNVSDEGSAELALDGSSAGEHKVSIKTSDATQGDVKLQELNYYDGTSTTPVKVNVLASGNLSVVGAPPDRTAITDLAFVIEEDQLKAVLDEVNQRTGQAVNPKRKVKVCDIHTLSVLTNTDYNTTQASAFMQQKQSVTVIGAAPSAGEIPAPENVFTTTPLSSELVS